MDEPCENIQPNHETKLQLVLPTLFTRIRVEGGGSSGAFTWRAEPLCFFPDT